ncbi:hypothetical protein D3C76_904100 [compost metagenome]
MPDHPTFMGAAGARRSYHLLNGGAHGMELVIAGNLLDQAAVILEQHEVAQVIEQHLWRQGAAHQSLQFVELTQRVKILAVDGAPVHEAFGIGRQ